jgi:hypothetical protein
MAQSSYPLIDKRFHVHIDASSVAIGIVLTQGQENKVDVLVYYASCFLNQVEKNYTPT